jgi:hypothetical protein
LRYPLAAGIVGAHDSVGIVDEILLDGDDAGALLLETQVTWNPSPAADSAHDL